MKGAQERYESNMRRCPNKERDSRGVSLGWNCRRQSIGQGLIPDAAGLIPDTAATTRSIGVATRSCVRIGVNR